MRIICVEQMTPEEAQSGEKLSVSHLQVFGSLAYAHIPKQQEEKGLMRGRGVCFVG